MDTSIIVKLYVREEHSRNVWDFMKENNEAIPLTLFHDLEFKNAINLKKFLCMTPSVWLLQHEYEFHGTCMHDESLEDPEVYFGKALALYSKLKLPDKKLQFSKENVQWFVDNNPHLKADAIQYYTIKAVKNGSSAMTTNSMS